MGITNGDRLLCKSLVFSLGPERFGFEEEGLLNYTALRGPYRKVPGAPDYVLGYAKYERREVLVQDLRQRFGFGVKNGDGDDEMYTIVYLDTKSGLAYGFVVDDCVDFCDSETRVGTHWGAEVLLAGATYGPFVLAYAQAEVDRVRFSFWLLRHKDLYPILPPANCQEAA